MKAKLFFVSLLVLFLSSSAILLGQTTIKGLVVDSLTHENLTGANVILSKTGFGSAVNKDGEYSIAKIPAGNYQITVSYIGYSSRTMDISVNGKDNLELNFQLKPQVVFGKEIVITGQMKGQVAAINQQITSNTQVNVVSADRIRELPDANAAESVGRLPGISLIRGSGEATKVVVRGLEPKLNAIAINGVKIPSTSDGDRSVDMSMIASESLEGIEVFKAPTPDMDAEAVGGVINLKMKKAPTERNVRLKMGPGYNQLKNLYGDYKMSGEFSDRFFDKTTGLVATLNYEKINRSSESWSGSYSVSGLADPVTGIVPVQGNDFSIRNVVEDRIRWGSSVNLDYKLEDGSIWLSNLYSSTSRNPFTYTKSFDPRVSDKISYEFDDREIQTSGLSNSLNGEFNLWGMDLDFVLSRYNITTDNKYEIDMIFEQISPFDKPTLKIDDFSTYIPSSKDKLQDIGMRSAFLTPNKTNQTDYTYQFSSKIPVNLGSDLSAFLKLGGKMINTDRKHDAFGEGEQQYYLGSSFVAAAQKYSSRPLILNPANGKITLENFASSPSDYMNIVNKDYKLFPTVDRNLINQWGREQKPTFKFDRTQLANCYEVTENIKAAYLLGQVNLGQWMSVISGLRYEYSDNWYKSMWTSAYEAYGRTGTQKDTSYSKTYGHVFPHLHLKFKPFSWFDLKFSANRSIARPDYSWISPYTRLDITNARIDRGNPDLIETKIWNYNLTASLYDNYFGYFAVSGFSKELSDISYRKVSQVMKTEDIVKYGIPGKEGGYRMTSYANSPSAKVYGIEVELQTQLALLSDVPDLLKGIVFNANYSRIWSETGFPLYNLTTSVIPGSRPPKFQYIYTEMERRGPMPGQANEILNLSLGYDIADFSVRLSMLYQGASLNGIGITADQDTWNDAFTRWDLSAKYKVTRWLNLDLNLMNISNQPDRAYFGNDTYQTNRFYYGMNANVGLELIL